MAIFTPDATLDDMLDIIAYNTATTHIKTIRIPIESTRTLLTTSWQTIGDANFDNTATDLTTGSFS